MNPLAGPAPACSSLHTVSRAGPRACTGWQRELSVGPGFPEPAEQLAEDLGLFSSLCHPSEWGGGSPRLCNVYLLIKMAGSCRV